MMLFKNYKKITNAFVNLVSPLFSFIFLILLMPLILVVSILIFILDGNPIIFRSKRVGLLGKEFTLYKFRTMVNSNQEDNARITKLGRFLRRSSIDEIPQLFNILKGDMLFVGPRPMPRDLLLDVKYKRYFMRRASVKPGLTGLAQIYSSGLPRSLSKKLIYDLLYIKKKSILFDLVIIIYTFKALRKRFLVNKLGISL
tara:strand:+ start:265 stop:861 length:597 start_codon:yes stop_codon:yes gene_type:complete